jgi:predicted alpha/beta hydrolase family esterase
LKRVIIIHGWADDPTTGWIYWLVNKLNHLGYQAVAPKMPNPQWPNQTLWLEKLNQTIGNNLDDTILVGHSLGCFVLMRYLEQNNLKGKLDKLILVAGFLQPKDETYKKYFQPIPDLKKISKKVKQIYCIYSDNDQSVDPEQTLELSKGLTANLILDKDKKHFAAKQGIIKLPSVFNLIIKRRKNE